MGWELIFFFLTVTYSHIRFIFHVCGVILKPCGCFQGAEIELGISPGTHSACLNLDFVTQLPLGNNGLSKPSLSRSPPWDWPFHCHSRIFHTHSTPKTHSLSSVDLFILDDPPWRAGKGELGYGIKIQQKLILKPLQWSTDCVPGLLNQCYILMWPGSIIKWSEKIYQPKTILLARSLHHVLFH